MTNTNTENNEMIFDVNAIKYVATTVAFMVVCSSILYFL